jgi:hypothetical protein
LRSAGTIPPFAASLVITCWCSQTFSNLERVLLAADESLNAKFASHIAGLLAGWRGLPITVLHVDPEARCWDKKRGEDSLEAVVKNAAKSIAEANENSPNNIDITTRVPNERPGEAIEDEARKGFTSSSWAWIRRSTPRVGSIGTSKTLALAFETRWPSALRRVITSSNPRRPASGSRTGFRQRRPGKKVF